MYYSTKHYPHDRGLSIAYRNHKAESHCKFLHGYALAITFTFAAEELDRSGFVVDFGGLKSLWAMLENTFDHKLLVAEDDPAIPTLLELDEKGLAEIVLVPAVGCEAWAELIFQVATQWMKDAGFYPRATIVKVEVAEHTANSAMVTP